MLLVRSRLDLVEVLGESGLHLEDVVNSLLEESVELRLRVAVGVVVILFHFKPPDSRINRLDGVSKLLFSSLFLLRGIRSRTLASLGALWLIFWRSLLWW